jgi:hypothetical protein
MDSRQVLRALADTKPSNLFEIWGMLSARVMRADGRVGNLGLISVKKVTTAFADYIVDSLQDSTTSPLDAFSYHAMGTDNTAESNTDTTLGTEVESRTDGSQTEGSSTNIYQTVGSISANSSHTITEHGIFSASSGGTLLDRSVFSGISVTSGDSIEFTYELTVNAEA